MHQTLLDQQNVTESQDMTLQSCDNTIKPHTLHPSTVRCQGNSFHSYE